MYQIDYSLVGWLAALAAVVVGAVVYKLKKKAKAPEKAPTLDDILHPGKDEVDRELEKKAEECAKEPDEAKRAEKVKELAKAAREFPRRRKGGKSDE